MRTGVIMVQLRAITVCLGSRWYQRKHLYSCIWPGASHPTVSKLALILEYHWHTWYCQKHECCSQLTQMARTNAHARAWFVHRKLPLKKKVLLWSWTIICFFECQFSYWCARGSADTCLTGLHHMLHAKALHSTVWSSFTWNTRNQSVWDFGIFA